MLKPSNFRTFFIVILISLFALVVVSPLTRFTMDSQALVNEIGDQRNGTSVHNPHKLDSEQRQDDKNIETIIRPPFVSPNPVGPLGQVSFRANETGVGNGIESINISIKGPNLGSTNTLLSPTTIGSLSMSQLSNTSRDRLWSGNFSFHPNLPDGNYVYSLTTTDMEGQERTTDSFSGIILNRHPPDFAETKIVSAMDGQGKPVSNTTITVSPNITFTFEGTDRSGVIQTFECNLDDTVIRSEHDHGEDPDENLTTYSTCFVPFRISSHVSGNHTYSELSPGNHTFKVRAIDNEYDIDPTPSLFSWSILPSET